MKQRIITAVIALALFALIVWVGKWAIFVTILCINAASLYEYLKVSSDMNDKVDTVFTVVLGSALLLMATFENISNEMFLYALTVSILLIFIKDIVRKKHDTGKTIYSVWGYIYISLFLSYSIKILFSAAGLFMVIMVILACIACDSFAYFFGIKFGKHKIAPDISPKKSVEGCIAGFFGAVVICIVGGLLYQAYFNQVNIPMLFFVFAGIIIGVFDQFGDLSASMIKRKFGVKDYGSALPGHGGFLDRIDGMLFSFAAMFVYMNLYFIFS